VGHTSCSPRGARLASAAAELSTQAVTGDLANSMLPAELLRVALSRFGRCDVVVSKRRHATGGLPSDRNTLPRCGAPDDARESLCTRTFSHLLETQHLPNLYGPGGSRSGHSRADHALDFHQREPATDWSQVEGAVLSSSDLLAQIETEVAQFYG